MSAGFKEGAPDDLRRLAHEVAELLDKVCVRSEAGFTVQRDLGGLMATWKGGGNSEAEALIQKAQGVVGMVNASGGGDPMRAHADRQLIDYKNELRRRARSA